MKLQIAHLYPDLLNLYGDRGNIRCMVMRSRWRGIEASVTEYRLQDTIDFARADLVLLGGGSDREQQIVCTRLQTIREEMKSYVEDGGTVLAVCGGYQLLGHYYETPEGRMKGLSLVDLYTEQKSPRLISNVVLENPDFPYEIVGFENHGGRTWLGEQGDIRPFGKVRFGAGNNGEDGQEGVLYRHVVGTYLHGPLLPKNPHVCDYLLGCALQRKYGDSRLAPLDDEAEKEANRYITERFARRPSVLR